MAVSQSLGSVLIHGYTAAGVFYEPYMTETVNTADNTSTLTIQHRIRIMEEWGGYYNIPNYTPIYVTIDGTQYSYTPGNMPNVAPTNVAVTAATTTHTVAHSSDGSKTITIKCQWNSSGASYYGVTSQLSIALTTIPRASSMTLTSSQTMGTSYTFNITKAANSFSHSITWSYGGSSGTAVSTTSSASPTFTPAIATFAPLCTTATSATITYTLNTYNGNALVGSKSYTATLAVPSSVVPSVSLAVSAVNPFNSLYLQGKSSVRLTATGSVSNDHGATIRSYSFQVLNSASTAVSSGSSSTSSTSATHTSGVLSGSGTHTCKVTITDSRGRTATATRTITVTAYSKPVWGTTSAYRCDSAGDVAEEGTYIALTAMAQYSAVSGNSISLTYQTKESTASSWSSATSYTNGQKTIIGSAYDITKAYNVKVTATDTVGNTITTTLYVSTSAVGIDYDQTNNTLGLLRYAPSGSLDSVYMPKGYAFGPDGLTFSPLATERQFGAIARAPIGIQLVSYEDVGTSSGMNETFASEWLKYICANYADTINSKNSLCPIMGLMRPDSIYMVMGFMYSVTDLVDGLPRYSSFHVFGLAEREWRFGTTNGEFWFSYNPSHTNPVNSANTVSITNGWLPVFNHTFSPGTYEVSFNAHFPRNATGNRELEIMDDALGTYARRVNCAAVASDYTILSITKVLRYSTTQTITFRAYQNSGAAMNVTGYLTVTKLW